MTHRQSLIERLENDAYWLNGATHVWDNAPYEAAALILELMEALDTWLEAVGPEAVKRARRNATAATLRAKASQ